ncbi:metal-dependent hydrolase [Clostridium sp.]|uniref:metal-dependent hydrolase n=1 Tax=Clostridium sp. TaxID=1506 RepID=UPI002A90B204|nr:metal-dependent hydrolase [Clostridium sp.]MDY6011954.1 metal-dependent hydrolase [Clostridium sp.]
MTKPTHSSGGFLIALITLNAFIMNYLIKYNISYGLLSIAIYFYASHIGSLFPDIDMKNSFISKSHPLIHKIFGKRFRHRGFTHSLLAMIILYIFIEKFIQISNDDIIIVSMCYGFFIGYASHLILDLITKEGIELLYPFKKNISIFFIKTNSNGEKIFNRFLKFIILIYIFYNIYLITKNVFHIDILSNLNLNKF